MNDVIQLRYGDFEACVIVVGLLKEKELWFWYY